MRLEIISLYLEFIVYALAPFFCKRKKRNTYVHIQIKARSPLSILQESTSRTINQDADRVFCATAECKRMYVKYR